MILANTVASAPVQGVSVQAAADDNPILGYGVVGAGRNWVSTPGLANAAINALGTLVANAAVNFDWSAYGYFTVTLPNTGTNAATFATTATAALAAASQVNSFQLGQLIKLRITGGGGGTITFPGTITWVAQGVAATTAPTWTGSLVTDVYLICTAVGSTPTFDATYIQT